jgi:hypothetical protein
MKLYLGDTSDNFALWALDQDPSASLGTNDNFNVIISKNDNIYTSMMDTSRENIIKLCLIADQIIVYDQQWEDTNLEIETKKFTDMFFSNVPNEFYNHLNKALTLNDVRKTDKRQLWAIGCSYTSSIGVEDHQRWAVKLSQKTTKKIEDFLFFRLKSLILQSVLEK